MKITVLYAETDAKINQNTNSGLPCRSLFI